MKLTQIVIDKLLADRSFRLKIALELGFSELWVNRLISANKINGPLLTPKSLEVIRMELGYKDNQIMEEAPQTELQN